MGIQRVGFVLVNPNKYKISGRRLRPFRTTEDEKGRQVNRRHIVRPLAALNNSDEHIRDLVRLGYCKLAEAPGPLQGPGNAFERNTIGKPRKRSGRRVKTNISADVLYKEMLHEAICYAGEQFTKTLGVPKQGAMHLYYTGPKDTPQDPENVIGLPHWSREQVAEWLAEMEERAAFDPRPAQPLGRNIISSPSYLVEKLRDPKRFVLLPEPIATPAIFKPSKRKEIGGTIHHFDALKHVAHYGGMAPKNYSMTWLSVLGAVTVAEQVRRQLGLQPTVIKLWEPTPRERRPFEDFMPWEIRPPGLFMKLAPLQGCHNRPSDRDLGNTGSPLWVSQAIYKILCRFPHEVLLDIYRELREVYALPLARNADEDWWAKTGRCSSADLRRIVWRCLRKEQNSMSKTGPFGLGIGIGAD